MCWLVPGLRDSEISHQSVVYVFLNLTASGTRNMYSLAHRIANILVGSSSKIYQNFPLRRVFRELAPTTSSEDTSCYLRHRFLLVYLTKWHFRKRQISRLVTILLQIEVIHVVFP